MPLIEFITLVHATPGAFSSLSTFYRTWCTRQSSRSAYPITFYADVTRPNIVYLISGWHSLEEYTLWINSEDRRLLIQSLPDVVAIFRNVLLNMGFDTIPRAARGLISVNVVTVDATEEDGDSDSVWAFAGMERSLGVRWTGCGEDVRSPSTLYRFTMYDAYVTEESISERHQRDAVTLMRRVGLPAASGLIGL